MLRNYLKIALRTLQRYRTYSLLNIIGLAVGLGCGMLIFLVIGFQLRFDAYHQKADRIYRVVTELHHENRGYNRGTPKVLGEVLRRDYPLIETTARIKRLRSCLLSIPNPAGGFQKKFQEDRSVCFAEPQLFDAFDFAWKTGSPEAALTTPNSVVLTEKMARKYFGDANPIGRLIRLDNQWNLTVTGVLKDHPIHTNLSDEAYISYNTLAVLSEESAQSLRRWTDLDSEEMTYVVLPESTPVAQVNAIFPALINRYYNGKERKIYRFYLQPLSDVHYNTRFGGKVQRKLLYAMGAVGLFLILAACINFVNMSTAHALRRSKEVGVRKAMGSTRGQLFGQFMAETALITLVAVGVALAIAQAGLPLINQSMAVFNANLALTDLLAPQPLALLLALVGLVIGLSGFYPSTVLSGFNPIAALRSRVNVEQVGGISVRRGLVVVQFFITQLFVIVVIVIMSQLRHIRQTELGFTKDPILTIPVPTSDPVRQQTLRNRLLELGTVQNVALGNRPPASSSISQSSFTYDNRAEPEKFDTQTKVGDPQYIPLFGLKLLAGRNFLTNDSTNREVIVNETMVKQLGVTSIQAVLGKRLNVWDEDRTIVGVVNDFHVNSLRMAVGPLVLFNQPSANQMAALKIGTGQVPETLKQVEETWNSLFPEHAFHYQFTDDILDQFYVAETIMLGFAQVFSGIAILIGCLGLFGLVSFMAESKTKEIGVRKVLGATVPQILWLFGREFGRLILLGFVVAAPLGWWLMDAWLRDYTYRIQVAWWVFALALLLVTIITVVTVSYQSIKAALTNPVISLRSE
ncbi:ABC transporter permease [Larkinella bovis]|uniref:ABC transporter permease n=1 Tax=Larkinella bovis TaxID=683041 RepID=A0ABW0IFS3_9BACT